MRTRRRLAAFVSILFLAASGFSAQQPSGYTIVSREGRRALPSRALGGHDMVQLPDVAAAFGLTVREDVAAGGIIVTTASGRTIVLTPGQPLVSAAGRVVSLPSAPVREGRTWLVPVEFLSRALAPAMGGRIDVRKGSRLVIVGDMRVPRVVASIDGDATRARVTLDISPATPRAVTQDGTRLIVRLEADAIDVEAAQPAQAAARELVAGVRLSEAPQNLIIELGPRAGPFQVSAQPREGGERVTIEIAAPGAPPAPAQEPSGDPLPAEPLPLPDLGSAPGMRTIVIDPGHGGDDTGARGAAGTLEKDVTLAIAGRLKAALEARLGVRVLLTRDGDRAMRVDERTSLANNNKADLFISIHANAAASPGPAGAEVFSLAREGYEAGAGGAAPASSLPVFGGGSRSIEIIPWDTAQIQRLPESERFSRLVHEALAARVPMNPHALGKAPFRVLIGANMPAVLVETGFLTNAEQERALAGGAFQNEIAHAIATAIERYRAGADAVSSPGPTPGTPQAPGGGR